MKSMSLLVLAASLLAGCGTQVSPEVRALREEYQDCSVYNKSACRHMVDIGKACGHGDMDACVLHSQVQNSPFREPWERRYWMFRATGE